MDSPAELAPHQASWDRVQAPWSRPLPDLILSALFLLNVGALSTISSIAQAVGGLAREVPSSTAAGGFSVLWVEFAFDGYAWIAVALPLGIFSLIAGVRLVQQRWLAVAVATLGAWAALALAQPSPSVPTALTFVLVAGVVLRRLVESRIRAKRVAT